MLRFDAFEIDKKPYRTDEGYLILPGRVARTGVLTYRNPDGTTRRELVTDEELIRGDSLESIALKPVTDGHPKEGRVDASNARALQRGYSLQKVRARNPYVEIDLLITDEELANKIERGDARELSLGYELERLDETPGTHPVYGDYDAIQIGRRGNHIAVVPRGRAGPEVSLRMDSAFYADWYQYNRYERGIQSDDLPSHVKELPDEERGRWLDAYWHAYYDYGDGCQPQDWRTTDEESHAEALTFADNLIFDSREDAPMKPDQKNKKPANATTDQKPSTVSEGLDALRADAKDLIERLEKFGRNDENGEENEEDYGLKDIASALGSFMEKMDGLKLQADEMYQKHDEMRGQVDALYADMAGRKEDEDDMDDTKQDRADAAPGMTEADMLKFYKERKSLEQLASTFRVDGADDLDNTDLKKAIVEKHLGKERVDGASDAEISGMLKAIQTVRARRDDSYQEASEAVSRERVDTSDAQTRYHASLANAWRGDSADGEDAFIAKLAKALKG